MQETAVDNPYGLGALIANGDIIARSILVILLIMSLLTWFIMITKFFDQRRTRLQAIAAEQFPPYWTNRGRRLGRSRRRSFLRKTCRHIRSLEPHAKSRRAFMVTT